MYEKYDKLSRQSIDWLIDRYICSWHTHTPTLRYFPIVPFLPCW